MVTLNSKLEVADLLDVSQFIPGKSAYECVAYAGALAKYAGVPGHGPTGSTLQASNLAQYWYGREEGSTDASNRNGMSLSAEYDMLAGMGLHYQELAANVQAVKDALGQGHPVLLCGVEAGMYDMDLGDVVPYSWTPVGNHCIVASGIASDGNLLVHDTANVGSSGVRPGPRRYDIGKLQVVSATAIVDPWQGAIMIPTGWHDDGTTLMAPNGFKCVTGFREWVLSHNWDANNVPLENEVGMSQLEASNPSLGGGTRQLFNWTMLEWTESRGVFVAWVGKELLYERNRDAQMFAEYNLARAQIAAQQTQIVALQAQLAKVQPNPNLSPDMQLVVATVQKYIM